MNRHRVAPPSLAILPLVAILLATPAFGAEGKTYGKGLTDAQLVKVSALIEKPDEWVGKRIRVEGLVTGVCKKRGCWIRIGGDKEFQSIRFKVKDGEMVFPVEAKGKHAVAEGVWTKHVLSKDKAIARAKHQAKEHGTPYDPKKVTGPETIYQVKGEGAVIK